MCASFCARVTVQESETLGGVRRLTLPTPLGSVHSHNQNCVIIWSGRRAVNSQEIDKSALLARRQVTLAPHVDILPSPLYSHYFRGAQRRIRCWQGWCRGWRPTRVLVPVEDHMAFMGNSVER